MASWRGTTGTAPSRVASSASSRSSTFDAWLTRNCSGWRMTSCAGSKNIGQSKSSLRRRPAREAIVYLGKAETAHCRTPALYALRARCRTILGEEATAQADRQRADQTPPTLALDHYLRGQAAYIAKQLAEGVQAF